MSSQLILDYVNSVMSNSAKRPSLSREHTKIATAFVELLRKIDLDEIILEEDEELANVEFTEIDKDWKAEDEECKKPIVDYDPKGPNLVRFGDDYVEWAEVEKALTYFGSLAVPYRNKGTKRPSLASMNSKFPFLKTAKHLEKLRDIEKKGDRRISRLNDLKFIGNELAKMVYEELDAGAVLHDADLLSMTSSIIRTNSMDISFIPSKSWLNDFKRAHRISSRHITKFVAKRRHVARAELEKKAEEFVATAVVEMAKYPRSSVFNLDQSGFQLQMMTKRTLARTNMKKVECVVQSVEATTHSYTVLPILSSDGCFFPTLFVVMQERNGKFPAKGHIKTPNLHVVANSSHIMNKKCMADFFENVVFSDDMPDDSLLVLDSWPCWKDTDLIDSVRPANKNVQTLTIPAGCTGFTQPLDVGVFYSFKKVIKHVSTYGQRTVPEFKINQRDNILKVLSLIFGQLCHPQLKGWLLYGWHASGYDTPHPPPFDTPSELMFPRDVAYHDCVEPNCITTTFLRCLYCQKYFCFSHFVVDFHWCV